MNSREQSEKRMREINTPKVLFFTKLIQHKFGNRSGVHRSFLNILTDYEYNRLDFDGMCQHVSILLLGCPLMISGFCKSFPQPMSTKDKGVETEIPTKKTKIEDDSSKAITVFDPTSNASTSYASTYSQSPCSSDCYPVESKAVASCSSSSPSLPKAAEVYEDQKQETAQSGGRTLYVTEMKTKLVDECKAYQQILLLVDIMEGFRYDTYDIMENVSNVLQGYPELIENFNIFLPDGYEIVVISDDQEMNID